VSPDSRYESLQKHESANIAIDEGYFTGSHTAPPPAGKQIRMRACDLASVEVGLVTEHQLHWDQMEFCDSAACIRKCPAKLTCRQSTDRVSHPSCRVRAQTDSSRCLTMNGKSGSWAGCNDDAALRPGQTARLRGFGWRRAKRHPAERDTYSSRKARHCTHLDSL
jgi:hypothetical protein